MPRSAGGSGRPGALLLVLSGNMLIDALEVSTIVVTMPSISAGFHLTPAIVSWSMIGFAFGFGAFIIPGRRMAAQFGFRRVYLAAMLVFALASLAGGLAANIEVLVATRVIKGLCVALTAPTGLAIIASTFPEGAARRRAIAVYSMFGASGFSAGLLLSGALTVISWRWALLFSGPAALLLFLAAVWLVPAGHASTGLPLPDQVPGATRSPWRARLPQYMPFVRSAVGAAALNGSYWGFLYVATFRMQSQIGWKPIAAGLALLPASVPLAVFASRFPGRARPESLIALGSLIALVGYAWYFASDGRIGYLEVIMPASLLVGLGFMTSFSALHIQATAGMLSGRQAAAADLYQTSVQIGGAVTLTLVAVVAGLGHRGLYVVLAVAAAGLLTAVLGVAVGTARSARSAAGRADGATLAESAVIPMKGDG